MVVRIDLNNCIGCENCVNICPMDVFYFNYEANKSVMAYPENCQSCGQCFLNCQGRALGMSNEAFSFPLTLVRGTSTAAMNHMVITSPGVIEEYSKGELPR